AFGTIFGFGDAVFAQGACAGGSRHSQAQHQSEQQVGYQFHRRSSLPTIIAITASDTSPSGTDTPPRPLPKHKAKSATLFGRSSCVCETGPIVRSSQSSMPAEPLSPLAVYATAELPKTPAAFLPHNASIRRAEPPGDSTSMKPRTLSKPPG